MGSQDEDDGISVVPTGKLVGLFGLRGRIWI
jgi:hypothetical protein